MIKFVSLLLLVCNIKRLLSQRSSEKVVQFGSLSILESSWREVAETLACWSANGKWVPDSKQMESHIYDNPCTHLRYALYFCSSSAPTMTKPKFHWEIPPSKCKYEFHQFNKEHFSKVIDGYRVMFVGDSVNEEFYVSFMSSLISTVDCEVCGSMCHGKKLEEIYLPPYRSHATSVRNDRFTLADSTDANHNFYDYDFYGPLEQHNISLLIMNRGAHYQEDDLVINEIQKTLTYLYQRHPNLAVIYRNTPPGHHDCGSTITSNPLKAAPKYLTAMTFDERDGDDSTHEHHWYKFHKQNVNVEAFLKAHFPAVLRLDVFTPTVLRADMHASAGDCLHYCLPGPIDTWVTILSNALTLAQQLAMPATSA